MEEGFDTNKTGETGSHVEAFFEDTVGEIYEGFEDRTKAKKKLIQDIQSVLKTVPVPQRVDQKRFLGLFENMSTKSSECFQKIRNVATQDGKKNILATIIQAFAETPKMEHQRLRICKENNAMTKSGSSRTKLPTTNHETLTTDPKIKDYIEKNLDKEKITISIPAGSDEQAMKETIDALIDEIKNNHKGPEPITTNFVVEFKEGISQIHITTEEIIKKNLGEQIFSLENLEANDLGYPEKIKENILTSGVGFYLNNPQTYSIEGGYIIGYASHNPTTYTTKFQEKSEGSQLTNNEQLAHDRAYLVEETLTQDPFNIPTGIQDISYKVHGPTRAQVVEDLAQKLKRPPIDDEIKEAFKPYQKTEIKLNIIETERIITEETFPLPERPNESYYFKIEERDKKESTPDKKKSWLIPLRKKIFPGKGKKKKKYDNCPKF